VIPSVDVLPSIDKNKISQAGSIATAVTPSTVTFAANVPSTKDAVCASSGAIPIDDAPAAPDQAASPSAKSPPYVPPVTNTPNDTPDESPGVPPANDTTSATCDTRSTDQDATASATANNAPRSPGPGPVTVSATARKVSTHPKNDTVLPEQAVVHVSSGTISSDDAPAPKILPVDILLVTHFLLQTKLPAQLTPKLQRSFPTARTSKIKLLLLFLSQNQNYTIRSWLQKRTPWPPSPVLVYNLNFSAWHRPS